MMKTAGRPNRFQFRYRVYVLWRSPGVQRIGGLHKTPDSADSAGTAIAKLTGVNPNRSAFPAVPLHAFKVPKGNPDTKAPDSRKDRDASTSHEEEERGSRIDALLRAHADIVHELD